MKITTEIQRNVQLLHLLNEKEICLRLTEKKCNFAATLAGSRVNEKITSGFRSRHGYFGSTKLAKIRTIARPNSPDMLPKRTKKVQLGITTTFIYIDHHIDVFLKGYHYGETLNIFRKQIRKYDISLLIDDGCKGCSLCSS